MCFFPRWFPTGFISKRTGAGWEGKKGFYRQPGAAVVAVGTPHTERWLVAGLSPRRHLSLPQGSPSPVGLALVYGKRCPFSEVCPTLLSPSPVEELTQG